MSGTVYLIMQPTVSESGPPPDLTPLYAHGRVRVLVESGVYPAFKPKATLQIIESRLADFDPRTDFIAWAGGDPLAAVMVGVVLERMELDNVKWLRYDRGPRVAGKRDRSKAQYIPTHVPLYSEDTDPVPAQVALRAPQQQ
jgi:hypothetical protein